MNWIPRWRALAARIEGLLHTGQYLIATFAVVNADQHAIGARWILPHFGAIRTDLIQFRDLFSISLPQDAATALNHFIENVTIPAAGNHVANVQVLSQLSAFRAEFDYLIHDVEIESRSATELAFEHLRRQIVVDAQIRKAWIGAFKTHETRCEELGAVHLLSHGIWAFKAHGDGAATDLVYNEPLNNFAPGTTSLARALVLTEWKRVTDPRTLRAMADEARNQARLYAGGLLGGIELRNTRYLVLVTERDQATPEDVLEGRITYRHIVIPTAPVVPSNAARVQRPFARRKKATKTRSR
jgi:hypothetical protein